MHTKQTLSDLRRSNELRSDISARITNHQTILNAGDYTCMLLLEDFGIGSLRGDGNLFCSVCTMDILILHLLKLGHRISISPGKTNDDNITPANLRGFSMP